MHPQFKDVVTRYKPSIIFSDGEWDMPSAEWRSPELLAWLFNDSPVKDEVVIDDRWGKDTRHKHGGYYTTEYTAGMSGRTIRGKRAAAWASPTDTTAWRTLAHYRTGRELVLMLIDLVSRGGNLLLDIGPTADGRIPVIMEERLMQMGDWLRLNGEAIYGTHAWKNTRQWSAGEHPKLEFNKEYMTPYDVAKLTEAPAGAARHRSTLSLRPRGKRSTRFCRVGRGAVVHSEGCRAGQVRHVVGDQHLLEMAHGRWRGQHHPAGCPGAAH